MEIHPAGLLILIRRASRLLTPTPPSPRQIPFKFMQPPTSIPFDVTVEVTQIELSLSKNHF